MKEAFVFFMCAHVACVRQRMSHTHTRTHRPHIPWSVPQQYYDLYPLDQISLAEHRTPPSGVPSIAMNNILQGSVGLSDPTPGCAYHTYVHVNEYHVA